MEGQKVKKTVKKEKTEKLKQALDVLILSVFLVNKFGTSLRLCSYHRAKVYCIYGDISFEIYYQSQTLILFVQILCVEYFFSLHSPAHSGGPISIS